MNVSLTPELEKFVQKEVAGGLYQTASEVVRAALRRLKEDKQAKATFPDDQGLEKRLLEGVARYERGECLDGETAMAELWRKIAKAKRARK
jgi:antitoxin ParD1/3/4